MRILMLGNSFTFYHDMPKLLSILLREEVVSHTRGGAYLSEQLNLDTEMGAKTQRVLAEEKWDYVVLQEQSIAPALHKEAFLRSVEALCRQIHANGARPVLYATWAYRESSERYVQNGLSYDEMNQKLYEAYHEAAEKNDALIADVGKLFSSARECVDVYDADNHHPSAAGSVLAAHAIAKVISEDSRHSKQK